MAHDKKYMSHDDKSQTTYFQHLTCVLLLCQHNKHTHKNVCLMYDENKSHVCNERLSLSECETEIISGSNIYIRFIN